MLINQPISTNEIVTLKLISGEEVIAKYISEDATSVTVSKPLALVNNGQAMVLAPFVMTAEKLDSVRFLSSSLMIAPTKTQPKVKNSYIQFTTGIQTAVGAEDVPPITL